MILYYEFQKSVNKNVILHIMILKKIEIKFIEVFGKKDKFKNLICDLTLKSYNNIQRTINNKNCIDINTKDINKIFGINNYKYLLFISRTLGELNNLYDFSSEYSHFINNTIKNYDFTSINNDLRLNGYKILDNKFEKDTCMSIKKQLLNINFRQKKNGNTKIYKGKDILDKQVYEHKSSLYWVINQDDILSIPEIKDIATDPFFIQIIQNYLGCNPILCQTNLWYSCMGPTNFESLGSFQTQRFHQDYDDLNFLKIFIYLSDVDKNSGPHVYISESLNNMKVPSNYKISMRITDKFAKGKYGNKIKTHLGNMGTIIFENTHGLHKGSPVIKGNRLILQFQYCSTMLPFQRIKCNRFSELINNEFVKKYNNCYLRLKS